MADKQADLKERKKQCPFCNKDVPSEARLCPHCKKRFSSAPPEKLFEMPQQHPSSGNALWEMVLGKRPASWGAIAASCGFFLFSLVCCLCVLAFSLPPIFEIEVPLAPRDKPSATRTPRPTAPTSPVSPISPTIPAVSVSPTGTLTATQEAVPAVGMGVTRDKAVELYLLYGFTFELAEDEGGPARYVGTVEDGFARVELVGPEEDITSASILIKMPSPATDEQSTRALAYLVALQTAVAKDWEAGPRWLEITFQNPGESTTTYENLAVKLVVTPGDGVTEIEYTFRGQE